MNANSTLPINIDSAKIFVGGLSWQSNEESLKKHFQQYGQVISVEVMKDRNTGDPRGFAFIVFDSDDTVDKIMKVRHEIDSKIVDVKRAQARGFAPPSIHPKARLQQQQQDGNDAMSVNSNNSNNTSIIGTNMTIPQKVTTTSMPSNDNNDNKKNNKIFVGGLPLHVDKEELSKHFSQYGAVTDAVVMMDPTHTRSRGFGFVTFESNSGAAQKAMSDQPHSMQGKYVEIKLAQPKEAGANNTTPGNNTPGLNPNINTRLHKYMNQDTIHNKVGLDNTTVTASTAAATTAPIIYSEFSGLAASYARNGWKAGFGSKAFGNAGWAVLGWDDGGSVPERNGFSFDLVLKHEKKEEEEERDSKRLKTSL